MSYIGGIQYSVDNRTNNELFSCIQRAEDMERIKADIMPMGYTGRIQANSSANYARNYYSQLHDGRVNDRDMSLYGKQPAPYTDPDLQQLSTTLMRESVNASLGYNPADANAYMKYKATRPKLTRQDLMDSSQLYAIRSVQPIPSAVSAVRTTFGGVEVTNLSARTTQILEGL